MKMKHFTIIAPLAFAGLSGCSHYADPANYAGDDCASLSALYGNEAERTVRDLNTPASDLEETASGEINVFSNADLYKNDRAKRDSDLRAAYRENGCSS